MSSTLYKKRRLFGLLSNRDIDNKLQQLKYRKYGYQNYKMKYNNDTIDIEEWIRLLNKKINKYEKIQNHKNELKKYLFKNDKAWK